MPIRRTPRAYAARVWRILRTEGLRPLVFRTLGELGYRRVLLLERELPPPDDTPFPPEVRYTVLTSERFPDFLAISQTCDEAKARGRLAAGHLCQLGYVDGEPASCCWLAFPGQRIDIDYLGIAAELGASHGYIYELYVRPADRRTGLVHVGFQDRIGIFRERGVQHVAAVAMPENQLGLDHALAAGFRVVGGIHRLHLPVLQRTWVRSSSVHAPMTILHA